MKEKAGPPKACCTQKCLAREIWLGRPIVSWDDHLIARSQFDRARYHLAFDLGTYVIMPLRSCRGSMVVSIFKMSKPFNICLVRQSRLFYMASSERFLAGAMLFSTSFAHGDRFALVSLYAGA